jgi:DNA-binding PadR family transcriptional regulator
MKKLTKHEEFVLLSICKLKENAYGVPIRKHISDLTGKSINYGSLCNTLYGLVKKGFIESRRSEPLAQKGGRRKVIYSLTHEGEKALKEAFEVYQQAWKDIPEFVTEG